MMPEPTNSEIADRILVSEGWDRYTNNPADKGGPTKFGVTQKTLSSYRGHEVTAEEVRAMKVEEARAICIGEYIVKPKYEQLTNGWLRYVVVDAAYNSGPSAANKMLQSALQVEQDGVLGPKTLAAANLVDGKSLARKFLAARTRFFGRITSKNLTDADKDGVPDNVEFISGWLNRVAEQMEALA